MNTITLTIASLSVVTMALLGAIGNVMATNTFYGDGAGGSITIGINDSGFGSTALGLDNSGSNNTALGSGALFHDTNGSSNTGFGYKSLYYNASSGSNTSTGMQSLYSNNGGSYNTAIGYPALFGNITGSYNVALGALSGTVPAAGTYNIHIGNTGLANDTNTIRIGTQNNQTNAYIAAVYGVPIANGVPVIINSSGHLGTVVSSARYKDGIETMEKASEPLLSLQPVTFQYKKELDANATPQFGLLAEDVAKIDPDLVLNDDAGAPYTVRYEAVNAMLLNEFLKSHPKVDQGLKDNKAQAATIAKLCARLQQEQKATAALGAGLENIDLELGLTKPTFRPVSNTFYGVGAGGNITTGAENSGFGYHALLSDTSGNYNSAAGAQALASNSSGTGNTAIGRSALFANTDGSYSTAMGRNVLAANSSGQYNTAAGSYALGQTSTGRNNIALGAYAGYSLSNGSYNIYLDNPGVASESNTIRIGRDSRHSNAHMAGIYGVTVSGATAVVIDSAGHLGTTTSSARFKQNIAPMDKASEAIFSLQPVTFRYKRELDPSGRPQFGLVAEEVAKVNPDLVARGTDGKPYTVRYAAINAMLLNEFLKAQRVVEREFHRNEAQQSLITGLCAAFVQQEKELAALRQSTRKISEKLTLTKPALRLIGNNTFYGTGAGVNVTAGAIEESGFGYDALHLSEAGLYHTAVGYDALYTDHSDVSNTAVGDSALYSDTTGDDNVALGRDALYYNTSGLQNTALGRGALYNNASGRYNVALGYHAGYYLNNGSSNLYIGNDLYSAESNTIRIGQINHQTNAYMAGIWGMTVSNGVPMVVDSTNHLGNLPSSARFKEAIKPMGETSGAIFSLRPVTFRYKAEVDTARLAQFGLVAEEVAKVDPNLVVRDQTGKPFTVRYEAVNAMLLNEFLKMHRQVAEEVSENEAQEASLKALRSALAEQQKQLAALRAQLDTIRVKLEIKKPAARLFSNINQNQSKTALRPLLNDIEPESKSHVF